MTDPDADFTAEELANAKRQCRRIGIPTKYTPNMAALCRDLHTQTAAMDAYLDVERFGQPVAEYHPDADERELARRRAAIDVETDDQEESAE